MLKYCYSNDELRSILNQNIDNIMHNVNEISLIENREEIYKLIQNFNHLDSFAKDIHSFCHNHPQYKCSDIFLTSFLIKDIDSKIFDAQKTNEYRELKANLPTYHTNDELYKSISNISDDLIKAMVGYFEIHKKYGLEVNELVGKINYITHTTGTDVLASFKSNIAMIEDYFYDFEDVNENIEIVTDEIFTYFLSRLGFNEKYIQYHCKRLPSL